MGYRSDVALACDSPAFYELVKRLKEHRVSLDYFDITKPDKNLWLITIDAVKWYGDGVQKVIEDWFDDCISSEEEVRDNYFHGNIHFIRTGDDYDDNEDKYSGDLLIDDGMYIERYISKPLDGDLVTIMCPWGYEE